MSSQISHFLVSENTNASYHLVFFITGNPGLISYYETFLKTLNELLKSHYDPSDSFHIYGQSLAGFDDHDERDISKATPAPREYPYSLEEQIQISLRSVQDQRIPSGSRKGQPYDSVILIGHSVGSYMLLEIIQRLRKSASPLIINAGILLFPTVTHIAQSTSGVRISTLFRIPDFPRRASLLAKALIFLAPKPVLKWLVGLVMRMPDGAAEVTTRFLQSRMGIWQALLVLRRVTLWLY